MGTINVSLPSDGDTADVADVNTPITTIVNEINGNLSNVNIATDAAIAGTKIASGGVDTTQLADDAVTPEKRSGGLKVGTFSSGDTTGNVAVTGVGFTPRLVRFQVFGADSVGSSTNGAVGFGVMDEDGNQWANSTSTRNGVGGGTKTLTTKSLLLCTIGTGAVINTNLDGEFVSMDEDGFTVNITTVSGGPYTIGYEAIA